MNEQIQNQPRPGGLGFGDIFFTMARHKWKIIFFLLVGAGVAGGMLLTQKSSYTSKMKLMVLYVAETRGPEAAGRGDAVREPDRAGSTIINSEIEILRSADLVFKAAEAVGPQKILAAYGGGTNASAAAAILAGGLIVDAPRGTTTITVTMTHRDPEVAQTALMNLKEQYLEKHREIHRGSEAFTFLEAKTSELRTKLGQFERDLQRRKNELNVTSVEDAKKNLHAQWSNLRTLIAGAEAEIAQDDARLKLLKAAVQSVTNTDLGAATNAVAVQPVNADTVATFRRLSDYLERLKAYEMDLLKTYTEESTYVTRTRQDIVNTEKSIAALGVDPAMILAGSRTANTGPTGPSPFEVSIELTRNIQSLKAKIESLTKQEEQIKGEITRINDAEGQIVSTERDRGLAEEQFLYFQKNLERARVDQSLNATKLSNISPIQEPTFGTLTFGNLHKQAAMAFAAILVFGIALAFVLDFVVNPSFKRAKEVEGLLRMPVFATLPTFGKNGHSKLKRKKNDTSVAVINGAQGPEIAPWDESDPMLPYYEAIRDRLVMSYAGDSHKPKIVGLTSGHKGAGVSRIAAGLAASLSRDVERKVLLIQLDKSSVGFSAFDKGRPAVELSGQRSPGVIPDAALVESAPGELTQDSRVEQDIRSLAVSGRNAAGASVVQSFCDLIPRLKAADYDYIIFDLPPISQTSGALRLASHMERTLFVIESEKTSKEQLKRVRSLLSNSGTKMAAIFNRSKQQGPRSLENDL